MNHLPAMDMHCHTVHRGARPGVAGAALFAQSVNIAEYDQHVGSVEPGEVWGLGLHPIWVSDISELDGFLERLPACSAIGEVGMDGSEFAAAPLEQQYTALDRILGAPEARDRIISLHAVLVPGEVIDLLMKHSIPGGIIHWYADVATVEKALAADIFYSINEATFAPSEAAEVIKTKLARNRILVETDAPYVGPGGAILHGPDLPVVMTATDHVPDDEGILKSGETEPVERMLAQAWDVSPAEVREQLWRNLAELESRVVRRPFRAVEVLRSAGY